MNLNANYTLSHTLDDGTFATFISVPEDVFRRGRERATSNQDARHRFVANFSLTGPSNGFLRNFQLSNIIVLQSPRPFTLFVGFDANNDLIPAADRVGNLARNTYKGDSLQTWDVRISRSINLPREGTRLELGVDAFNFLNRANVDEVVGVYGTYNLCGGQQPRQYKDAASHPGGSGRRLPGGRASGSESPFRYSQNDVQSTAATTVDEAVVLIDIDCSGGHRRCE